MGISTRLLITLRGDYKVRLGGGLCIGICTPVFAGAPSSAPPPHPLVFARPFRGEASFFGVCLCTYIYRYVSVCIYMCTCCRGRGKWVSVRVCSTPPVESPNH